MSRCHRTSDRLNKVIKSFLERYKLLDNNSTPWEIKQSNSSGFGVFTTKDFDAGEVIFKDYPVIIGPRCVPDCPKVCMCCFSKQNLNPCPKGCGLDLCSDSCQSSSSHQKECKTIREYFLQKPDDSEHFNQVLYENVTPLRSLFLDEDDKEVVSCLIAHDRDEHGREIDTLKSKLGFRFKEFDESFLRFVCCVMDANAFEVALGQERCQSSVRGLYPLASLANHSCVPNTTHVFNDKHEMVVKAAVFIPKDSELFHCYTRLIWGTTTRLFHLRRTKHFICKCPRCKDPTEFGACLDSVLCKLCRGIVTPLNPYQAYARWQCKDCKNVITGKEAGQLTSLLVSVLKSVPPDDFPVMLRLLNGKLKSVVPENNQVSVELKCKIIWVLGHKPRYAWSELSLEQLDLKEQICNDILNLLDKLRCGQCKMRGLLLYELFCCKREAINRAIGSKQFTVTGQLASLLQEAASILEHDVTAPQEIKDILGKC